MSNSTANSVGVRAYEPADYARVREILDQGNLFYEPFDASERLNEKILRDPKSIFVAVRSSEIIGTVSIMEDGRMPFIFRLAVKQEFRNAGIGIMLMDSAEKELFSRGYKEVHILVETETEQLQGYYAKQGYEKGNSYRWMTKER